MNLIRLWRVLVLQIIAVMGTTGVAHAVCDFTVTTGTDGDDPTVNGTCASPSAAGACTLRAAVKEANAAAGGEVCTITFASGVSTVTLTLDGAEGGITTDNSVGDLDITRADILIDGSVVAPITIQQTTSARVFHVASVDNVLLRGLIIKGGRLPAGADSDGGGVFLGSGALVSLESSRLDDNVADIGAGLATRGYSRVRLSDVTVTNNSARVRGGGVSLEPGWGGGSIREDVIERSSFSNNSAPIGGGLLVADNNLTGVACSSSQDPIFVRNSTFFDNEASSCASGICVNNDTTSTCVDLRINQVTVAYNRGTAGIGVSSTLSNDPTRILLFNSIVAQNQNSDCLYTGPAPSAFETYADYNAIGVSSCAGQLAAARPNDVAVSAIDLAATLSLDGAHPPFLVFGAASTARDAATTAIADNLTAGNEILAYSTLDQRARARPFGSGADIGAVEYSVDLEVVVTATPSIPAATVPFTLTVTINNHSPFPSGQVDVAFTLPAGVSGDFSSATGGTCTAVPTPSCTVDGVAGNGTRSIVLSLTAATAGQLVGSVTAATSGESAPSDNTFPVAIDISAAPVVPPVVPTPDPTPGASGDGDEVDETTSTDPGDLGLSGRKPGCGCSSSSADLRGLAALAVLVLILRRRRI